VRRRLLAAGLLLALIALMQPIWGTGVRTVKQHGVDLLICLDLSRSMLARDLSPTRLRRAQHEIRTLADAVENDRLGLLVFAGEARLLVPFTRDTASFAELADLASPSSVPQGGSDLGAALKLALELLDGQAKDHGAVLLLTDGEDLEERGQGAAEGFREKGIKVHCVGFGSTRGSKIALEDEGGETFLKDRSHNEVVSVMDAAGLSRIAETTGGEFAVAGIRPLPLLKIYEKEILPMKGKAFDTRGGTEGANCFQWPLLAAFLLFILELGISERRTR
jgi:Ca-activated chloride channel family protein